MDIMYVRLSTLILAMFFGVVLSVMARYLRIPAIAPLLIGGVVLGPEVLGLVDSTSLGGGLRLIVALCVATILFEGGLTLDRIGFGKAQGIILKLLTLGVLITWLGTAISIYLLYDFSIAFSILAGSLIIVTGPTVIAPLLQRIKIKENLHHILHWEGVLIDPIGVFVAILCFEWLSIKASPVLHLTQFSLRLLTGIVLGGLGGNALYWTLKKKWIPDTQVNIFVFTAALFLYGLSDLLMHEAGILTVVIAGLVLGWKKPVRLRHILRFKSELTEIAIAVLFILLAANLKLYDFMALGWTGIILTGIVLLVIRPVSIGLCTWRSSLSLRERLFLSWVAPRGVVAASMASLFALELAQLNEPDASFLEAFTYSIIGTTVILQGLLSRWIAGFLGVKAPLKKGWLIVGAHFFSRKIAEFITRTTRGSCVFIDTNADMVQEIRKAGLFAYQGNALVSETVPDDVLPVIGNVLALTDNRDLNELICERWSVFVKPDRLFRWSPVEAESSGHAGRYGIPVWAELPKPSRVAYELKNKQVVLLRSPIGRVPARLITGTVPLMARRNNHLELHSFRWSGEGDALLFQQVAAHLPFYVHAEHIFSFDVPGFEELIATVLQHAKNTHDEIPYSETLSLLLKREEDFPTILGNGVAIPHAYCEALKEPLCLVARVPRGIDLHAYDKQLTRLFFVLLSSPADPETHLVILADIARIASNRNMVHRILEAKTPGEVRKCLMEIKDQAG